MDEYFDEATLMRARQIAKQLGKHPAAALKAIDIYSYACIQELTAGPGVLAMFTLFSNSKDAAHRALIMEAFKLARLRCDFDTFMRVAYNIFEELDRERQYVYKTDEQIRLIEEKEREVLKSAKHILIDFLRALQKIADNPQAFFRANQAGLALAA